MKKRKCRCSHVYIIGFENGPVKIGMSSSPNGRVSAVRNFARAGEAKLLWSIEHEDASSIEAASHWYLMMYEAGQEWFFIDFNNAKAAVEKAIKYYDTGKIHRFYKKIMHLDKSLIDAAKQSYSKCNTWWLHFAGHDSKVKGFLPIYKKAKAECLKDRKARKKYNEFVMQVWGGASEYRI